MIKVWDQVHFCCSENIKFFYKLILPAFSEGKVVDFLYTDKLSCFLQVDISIFGGHGHACPDNQSNSRILQKPLSKKRLDVWSRF